MTANEKFYFATNHADPAVGSPFDISGLFEAVLLSEKYTTRSTLKKVGLAKDRGAVVISDNGNFSRMSKIAKRFSARGFKLLAEAEAAEAVNGIVPGHLLMQRELLIEEIAVACAGAVDDAGWEKILDRQLSCAPSLMIGPEDFVIPVLTLVGLMAPAFKPDPSRIRLYQQNTIDLYLRASQGGFGNEITSASPRSMLVVHAYDFDSARQGGEGLLAEGISGVAISFGGPMASKEYVKGIRLAGVWVDFSSKLPESYLVAIAITAGVTCGLHNKNMPVHVLGLGSPILIVLLAYFLRRSTAVSIDATSTFKDADDGNIYALEPAALKLDMYKVAAYCLIDDAPYQLGAPSYAAFEAKYPSDWGGLRARLGVNGQTNASELAKRLQSMPELLEAYIPYFTPMRKGRDAKVKAARQARSASNYWVLKEICARARAYGGDRQGLKMWLFREVEDYAVVASPRWVAAVREILSWIDRFDL